MIFLSSGNPLHLRIVELNEMLKKMFPTQQNEFVKRITDKTV